MRPSRRLAEIQVTLRGAWLFVDPRGFIYFLWQDSEKVALEKSGLFEHPARGSPVVLDIRTIEFPLCRNSFSAAC